ncbi:hypothetical protein [Ramlibacter tataouinensis]|nr:hypothetical protein [Ramlibacter tataouinensis]
MPFFEAEKRLAANGRRAASFETSQYGPWPFDGPLDQAKVVICLGNPRYSPADAQHAALMERQRSGQEPLPKPWDSFYGPNIARPIDMKLDDLRRKVCVLNVCPYPSRRMEDTEVRFAAGLPSIWAAQKFLREVLLPRAESGELLLVLRRKHQLWGVHEGFAAPNIALVREPAISARLTDELGKRIKHWLEGQASGMHSGTAAGSNARRVRRG